MKAVIMAGGEGSRLRPLTCDIPKPMARLLGRPVLEYILDLLSRHGVQNASLTVRYLPDRITEHFPDAMYKNIRLDFVEENEPLGTAGSVKNACLPDDNEVLVISGDAMCDFDLAAAMKFHRETRADVTIAAKRVADPREYGLIDARDDGAIAAFIEKPAFSQAVSDLANTGIYILSKSALAMIPDGKMYDFAKDLFPQMLAKGMRLMCWEGTGYWCDIGDLETYILCQQDMLKGMVDCEIHGIADGNGNIFVEKRKNSDFSLTPPVYIGKAVVIEDGAVIEAGSVLDDGCYVAKNARITASVLLQKSYTARRARLTGALLCAGATVKSAAMLFEGSAVGAGAVVGEKSVINAGIKVWNKKVVGDSVNVTEHVKIGSASRGFFDEDGIMGQIGVELTPEFMARVGAAVGSLNSDGRIALGFSSSRSAEVLAAAVGAGIQSTGAAVINFGSSFAAQFEFSMNFCSLPLGVFVKGDSRACLRVLGAGGISAGREAERSIEAVLSRGEFTRAAWDAMGDSVQMTGLGALYVSQLLRFAPRGLSGMSVKLRSSSLVVKKTLGDALYKLGCGTDDGFTLEVSAQGDKVRVYDSELGYTAHHKIFAWCAVSQMKAGNDIAVPFDSPRILDSHAEKYGVRLHRYLNCPADSSDAEARKLANSQMWSRDGLMQAVMFLDLVKKAGGLHELLAASAEFDREERVVATEGNPAGIIRAINSEKAGTVTEGVLIRVDKGIALVKPLKRGTGIKIMAEAMSAETASELCDDIEKLLKDAIEQE